jgi:hypothetical protein
MVEKPNDGGPAFPLPGLSGLPNDQFIYGDHGMSLRDYFAAHSPITMRDAMKYLESRDEISYEQVFRTLSLMRYSYADAMLVASATEVSKP